VNIPSYEVKTGDEVGGSREDSVNRRHRTAREFTAHQTVPSWLQLDSENMKGRILNLPKREDITLPINEQLIVELYSK